MALQKCQIKSDEAGIAPIIGQYNPTDLKIGKSVGVDRPNQATEDSSKLSLEGGNPFSLNIELLFDTSDSGENVHTKYTKNLLGLMQIGEYKNGSDKERRPPYCIFIWGSLNFKWKGGQPFSKCYIERVSLRFNLFKPDGTPVRAKATVAIKEVMVETQGQNPTTRTEARSTWRVMPGETIDWIAYKEYGDSGMWRIIAEANNLANPKILTVGQLLRIPKLASQSVS